MAKHPAPKQCKSCPFKKGTDCAKDIPNYSREQHEGLLKISKIGHNEVQQLVELVSGVKPVFMSCHYSKENAPYPCVGALFSEAAGGNISARMYMATLENRSELKTEGEQHETLKQTLGDYE